MKNKAAPFLSKSKYLSGLQCPKLVWYGYNRRDELPEYDANTLAIFAQGRAVGELAQTLYPGGIVIERDPDPLAQSARSLEAAKLRKPLFEAGFVYKQAYALADILVPVAKNAWDLIEVKSTTKVKEEHLSDVAFQKYVYEGAGLKIRKCYLMYINNQYVRNGPIEPKELFATEDITQDCEALLPGVEPRIADILRAIRSEEMPQVQIGPQCEDPYKCVLKEICWGFLPKKGSVFSLYYGKRKAFECLARGILSITELAEDGYLSDKQYIQLACYKNGSPHIDRQEIRDFLSTLEYPLYFIDFETINPAIPLYDNIRPYEAIPFQYSLFIVTKKGATPERHAYLAPGENDPRPEILQQLKSLLGNTGSIVAYNATYEKTVLRHASEAYPEYQRWVADLEDRIVDLLVPFRTFSYYHPDQEGSASLKRVLPLLTDETYDEMEIDEGSLASIEYSRVSFGKNVDEKERQRVYKALEEYCDLDTKGMIKIVASLSKVAAC